MLWISLLVGSHLLAVAIGYRVGRTIWYRRGLDDAWSDYAGAVFR